MWYNSSADAKKLSLSIRGFFTLGLIATIVAILNFTGVDVDATDFNSLLDSFQNIVVGIGTLGAALMTGYGLLRKIFNKVVKRK